MYVDYVIARSDMHEISIVAEKLFSVGSVSVTNSMLTTVLVSLAIVLLAILYRRSMTLVPSRFQSIIELPIEMFYKLTKDIAPKHVEEFFPLVTTIFIFVLLSNWLGLVPGISGVGIQHGVDDTMEVHASEEVVTENTEAHAEEEHASITPFIRPATTDLNATFALALIAVIATHYYGIKHLGLKLHLKKFFNFSNPMNTFVGLLELISEFSRILSFSFRLFGNIFAGEVLLMVMFSLIPLLVPIPFIGLEIFVGFIQALVFGMLTLVLASVATHKH